MEKGYPFTQIETKWQRYWVEEQLFQVEEEASKKKYYVLEMFPYPSGEPHMGHVRNYSLGDVVARYLRMRGYNVLHPMGYDAFGLPAENAAIQRGVHPAKWTWANIEKMRSQLKRLGISYDWEREFATCEPSYYKWTQWFFLQLYHRGLAYKKMALVNWCPQCATVLANEQVIEGECWRCHSLVTKRELEQWFFKITEYADRLLADLDELEGWPEKVKVMQRNWIGKSYGVEIDFGIKGDGRLIPVYTTRQDTIYGVTYLVLAPEHPLLLDLVRGTEYEKPIQDFINKVKLESEITRTSLALEKEGIFIGRYATNPMNDEEIPIYVADYVLMEYGTGAVMGVPAHDERDFKFARRHNLPIRVVIQPPDRILNPEEMTAAYVEAGKQVNSGTFDGLDSQIALERIADYMEERGIGRRKVNYKLRDWLVSRQRYWGAPIPIIYCERCGLVPAPYEDLPVLLPENVDFTPGGLSPLAKAQGFVETSCPRCQGPAKRETDTMDTFVCSSWYYLRYTSPKDSDAPFEKDAVNYWMPVDQYIGGIEHAVLHLLYSRFFTKFLYDLGLVNFKEPFTNLFTQGMVLKDGFTMSKSRGNVVEPKEMIEKYGADSLRLFILFAAPPEKEIDWSDKGIEGGYRFLNRIWRLIHRYLGEIRERERIDLAHIPLTDELRALRRRTHLTIKKVTEDMERGFHFNTAISAMMELYNEASQLVIPDKGEERRISLAVLAEAFEALLLLLAPFAPHIAEELWERIGNSPSILKEEWPTYDEEAIKEEEVTIVVQVDGKLRGRINVPASFGEEEIKKVALENERIKSLIRGSPVKRVVVVPKRLVNIVVR